MPYYLSWIWVDKFSVARWVLLSILSLSYKSHAQLLADENIALHLTQDDCVCWGKRTLISDVAVGNFQYMRFYVQQKVYDELMNA